MLRFYTIVALCLGVYEVNCQNWISPCPSLFQYDPKGVQGDTWYADVTLKTEQALSGIWMRIVLDRPPIEINTDFGDVVQRESTEYLIRRPDRGLKPGETEKVRLSVKFNTLEPAPQLLGYRLNARVVCPESGILDKNAPLTPPPPPSAPQLQSPCPDIFQYEPLNETDRWFGVVSLRSDTPLNGIWLRIMLDRESTQLGVSEENWFGEVMTGDNKEYVIKNTKHTLLPGSVTQVKFFIKFKPGGPVPKVVELRLNAKTICQADVLIVPVGQNPASVVPVAGIPNTNQGSQGGDDFFSPDFAPGRKPLGEP